MTNVGAFSTQRHVGSALDSATCMVITTSGIVRHGGGDQLSLIELSKDYERPPSAVLGVTGFPKTGH